LKTVIRKLRAVLEDDARQPRFIEKPFRGEAIGSSPKKQRWPRLHRLKRALQ
jgi:hypothetical protein